MRLGEHRTAWLRVNRVTSATSSGVTTLVIAGFDVESSRVEAIEVLEGGWEHSRFAFDEVLKARGYTRARSRRRAPDPADADPGSEPAPAKRPSPSDSAAEARTKAEPDGSSRGPPTGGGKRRRITIMTDAQRRSLRDKVRAVVPSLSPRSRPSGAVWYPASFLSLTYPGRRGWRDWFLDPHRCKGHLRAFWRRIVRRHPGTWAIWALELQERDNLPDLPPGWHFHLLVRWADDVVAGWAERRAWLARSWAEVVFRPRRPHPDHVRKGVLARPVTTPVELADYLAKHSAKTPLDVWMRHGGPFLPDDEADRIFASRVARVRRAIRRHRIDTNQGAWSDTFNKAAYRRSCSVYAVRVSDDLAARVRLSIEDWWRTHFHRRGIEPRYGLPGWLVGDEAVSALAAAGVTARELLSGPGAGEVIDVSTGEPVDLG